MLSKLDKGIWTDQDIPVYKEDIESILPALDNPASEIPPLIGQGSGKVLNPAEQQLAGLVGEENAPDVFKYLKENGMFRLTLDMGYNVPSEQPANRIIMNKKYYLGGGDMAGGMGGGMAGIQPSNTGKVDGPYDSGMSGMDDRADVIQKSKRPGHLDWKGRAKGICEQIRQRGMDPLDFGCIPEDSTLSPAYSWRGHTKMVCGRLGATMDPGLPETCGCPPPNWKGWSLPDCLLPPAPIQPTINSKCGENDFK
jgi:hypothetical protein